MAGSLIKIDEEIVTSAVSSVTLTGIDSDDVYMVAMNNVAPTTDSQGLLARVTESGTANTTSNYDYAFKQLDVGATFSNQSATNITYWLMSGALCGTGTSETNQGIYNLYNFNNASEYSFITTEGTNNNQSQVLHSITGGSVFTSASACDGLEIFFASGNIASGIFTLYKLSS